MGPLVSVVVPSLNRPGYLRAALRSIESQTFKDFELIVQDNASATDVAPVVAEFPSLHGRIYRNSITLTQTQNIALGISRTAGKYVAILCDDDLWCPEFLATMVAALEQRPDCVLAFANLELIDSAGTVLPSATEKCISYHGIHLLEGGYYKPFEHLATLYRSIAVFSGCVFRRSEVDLSGVPSDLATVSDIYIGFLAARSGGAAYYCADRLFQVRYHPGTLTSRGRADPQEILVKHKSNIALWDAMLKDPRARHKHYYQFKRATQFGLLAGDLLKQGQWREGLRQIASRSGILDVRLPFYFLYFLYYVKATGINRRLMP